MNYPHTKIFKLIFLFFVLASILSCTKDSDLLANHVLKDAREDFIVGNYLVNDNYTTKPNNSIILDVLANDVFVDPGRVKIIETSSPVNGEVIIIENKTLLYIPASTSSSEESVINEPPVMEVEANVEEEIQEVSEEEIVQEETSVEEETVQEETPIEEETTQEETVQEETPIEEETTSENLEVQPTEEVTEVFTYTTEIVNEDETVTTETATVTVSVVESGQDLSGLKTVAQFKTDFDIYWESTERARFIERSLSGNGGDIYYFDGMQALVAIFQATGDKKYVDDAIELTKNLIATAKPSNTLNLNGGHNDSYLSWVSDSRTSVTGQGLPNGGQASLHETRGFQHVAKFLWVLHESPNLRANGYQADYQMILNFVETHIWEKWFSRDSAIAFSSAVDKSSAWAKIGFYLHKVTGKSKYRLMFDRFNTDMNYVSASRSMREILEPNTANSSAYQWPRLWSGNYYEGASVSDLNHANRAVNLLVDANEFDDFWTDIDMTKLLNTWTVFWPSGDGAVMKKFIDGTGGDAAGYVEPGWIKLGRFDTALQGRLEDRSLHNAVYNAVVCLNHAELAYNRAYMEGSLKYPENQWMH